jgi:hypothetical protein
MGRRGAERRGGRWVAGALWLGLLLLPAAALAADPGGDVPLVPHEGSDQHKGAILFYNLYSSSATDPSAEDTHFRLTNTSTSSAAFVRLLFVNGDSGEVAHSTICLTATQTATFRASEIRPGQAGFLIAVSIDGVNGCPFAFNHLIGQADVRVAPGFRGSLGAVTFPALYNGVYPGCDSNSVTQALQFDGLTSYPRLPRLLELSALASPVDARTLLVVNRVAGNLGTGLNALGTVSGLVFDDAQNGTPFTIELEEPLDKAPQVRAEVTSSFPATVPSVPALVPSGRTGWLQLFPPSLGTTGYLGAALTLQSGPGGPGSAVSSRSAALQGSPPTAAVTGAVNLRGGLVSLGTIQLLNFPIQPPTC